MPKIKIKENESIDSALRRFKKQVNRSKNLLQYRDKEFFISKSEKKRQFKKEKKRANNKKVLQEKNKKPSYY